MEHLLPAFIAVPGVKIGLANIAVIFTLLVFGVADAATVSLVRLIMASLLFGSPLSFCYGLCGAAVSLAVMALLKKSRAFGIVGISVAGGVSHNAAQIALAACLVRTAELLYYLPVLILCGTVAGLLTGVAALASKRAMTALSKK